MSNMAGYDAQFIMKGRHRRQRLVLKFQVCFPAMPTLREIQLHRSKTFVQVLNHQKRSYQR